MRKQSIRRSNVTIIKKGRTKKYCSERKKKDFENKITSFQTKQNKTNNTFLGKLFCGISLKNGSTVHNSHFPVAEVVVVVVAEGGRGGVFPSIWFSCCSLILVLMLLWEANVSINDRAAFAKSEAECASRCAHPTSAWPRGRPARHSAAPLTSFTRRSFIRIWTPSLLSLSLSLSLSLALSLSLSLLPLLSLSPSSTQKEKEKKRKREKENTQVLVKVKYQWNNNGFCNSF